MFNIRDFQAEGHYYTAYPSLNHWSHDFGHEDYRAALAKFCRTRTPAHLYVHIPFCAKLCHYCICNVIISNDRQKIQHFLNYLIAEIEQLALYRPVIKEIQLGGGTPSHLDHAQFGSLMGALNEVAQISSLDEFAMEIDPRTVKDGDLEFYAAHGVTRISFGVQDFNPEVQKAINREQPYEMVAKLMEKRHLFKGVNFDLLYGLPLQTHATIADTLAKVKSLAPDRITLLKYCHVPEVRRHMKLIKETDLPPKSDMEKMFTDIIGSLLTARYEWIGFDHFAKRHDSLAAAAATGTVGRTFNGFTPGRVRDLIGVGPTATGAFGNTYSQAQYDLKAYYEAIDCGRFPILRGYTLTEDDAERRRIIMSLMCNQRADINAGRFGKELLAIPADLATYENGVLSVTSYGRVLLRNICRVFDAHDKEKKHFKIAQLNMTRREAA